MAVLDTSRPFQMLGPQIEGDHGWAFQDGEIMSWSESNMQFETAWWLNSDGTVNEQCGVKSDHLSNIIADRPFDPLWLQE